MRRGETLALKWDNINLEKQTVKIKESLAYTKEHGLIFTTSTLLIKQGINPKIVSERLGHANGGITLDIYFYTGLDMQIETVSKLEEMLG
ncbi:hypothetical protein [Peribacillus asahii]|uniref:hypothetical protein n=1 Tax=Peribacillus asahii TaxID=228899 RepID=UPI00382AA827